MWFSSVSFLNLILVGSLRVYSLYTTGYSPLTCHLYSCPSMLTLGQLSPRWGGVGEWMDRLVGSQEEGVKVGKI